jgi:putative cell wall-binding protein
VFVATGENFPDALAGGPLAAKQGGPILLTRTDRLPSATVGELQRLNPASIVVLGGEGAVSAAVVRQLAACTNGPVTRLAGTDRYGTATAISEAGFDPGVDVVFIATGANYPDALAGGPVAGRDGHPVLLVRKDAIPAATHRELNRLKPESIVILGGTGVISTEVEYALAAYITG